MTRSPRVQSPRASALNFAQHPEGGWVLGVFGKRTLVVADGACVPAKEQLPLVERPSTGADPALLARDSDLLLNRALTDVIVEGHAFAPGGSAASFEASVQVGPVNRTLLVSGERRVERDSSGRLRFTPPAKVDKVPLAWASAYGGVDRAALDRYGDAIADVLRAMQAPHDPRFGMASYPRNPFGRGYLLEPTPAGLAACSPPLIEDPAHLLTPDNVVRGDPSRWPLAPLPASLGWVSHNLFPRTAQIGLPLVPYDTDRIAPADFPEVKAGWLKADSATLSAPPQKRIDFRMGQSAPPQMRGEVTPGARARLVNLHPRAAEWRFTLPERAPQIIVRLPGEEPVELAPRMASVVIEPAEDRLAIVWTGELRVALPLSEERLGATQHAVVWRD